MSRMLSVAVVGFALLAIPLLVVAQDTPQSDPQALNLAQQSVAALTSGVTINDATLTATVASVPGSNNETGTGTFQVKGTSESRVSLRVSGSTRDEVRTATNGLPSGAWKKDNGSAKAFANHNCWTDAAWFFPALSSLTQTANPKFIFKYVGQEQRSGISTQHIRVFQVLPVGNVRLFQRLSTMDFYLDSASLLPVSVAFNMHADKNAGLDLRVTVKFSSYQTVEGVAVPMHIQRYQQGALMLDATISGVSLNQGLDPSIFSVN